MVLDEKRVAEIWVQGTCERGTGYVLCDGCLLTAQHVIKGCGKSGVEFRLLSVDQQNMNDWISAKVIWENFKFDLALLVFSEKLEEEAVLPLIDELALKTRLYCRTCGFPSFRKGKNKEDKEIFHPYPLEGWIKPLALPKDPGQLLLEIEGSTPSSIERWRGLSGSAVFTHDGNLIGVVTQGSEELRGKQLEVIALKDVIEKDSSFSAKISQFFERELLFASSKKSAAKKAHDAHFDLIELNLKKGRTALEAVLIDTEIERCKRREEEWTHMASSIEISTLPQKKFLDLLRLIEESHENIFWDAWQKTAVRKNWSRISDVEEVYVLLCRSKDSDKNIKVFLSSVYHSLTEKGQKGYIEQLASLSRVVHGLDFDDVSALALGSGIKKSGNNTVCSLLVKVKPIQQPKDDFPSYTITIWLIKENNLYQERFRSTEIHPVSLNSYSEKLVDSALCKIKSKDPEVQSSAIKQTLSELINDLWGLKNKSLGLRKIKPDIIFCVPTQLLDIDFHNMKLGGISFMGIKLSVFVSCLERYEGGKLDDYRNEWIERWQVLEARQEEICLDCFEKHTEEVDITCPFKLNSWLERQAHIRTESRPIVGLGFYSPYKGLMSVFKNLLMNGLPIVFWPKQPLEELGMANLESSLEVIPSDLSSAFKRYRAMSEDEDAGTVSLLLDNPYFPPPDCEIDYY